jgi:S-DNA-T family DNA segregation ATPase FtsK/SpoIIIE
VRWFGSVSYQRKSEIFGFLLIVLGLFTALSLATHEGGDDRWIHAGPQDFWADAYLPRNLAGTVGALLSNALFEWFGFVAWGLVLCTGSLGLNRFLKSFGRRGVVISILILAAGFLSGVLVDLPAAGRGDVWTGETTTLGGWMARSFAGSVVSLLGVAGGMLIIGSILIGGALFLLPWQRLNVRWPQLPKRKTVAERRAQPRRSVMATVKIFFARLKSRTADWVGQIRRPLDRRARGDDWLDGGDERESAADVDPPDDGELPNWSRYGSTMTIKRAPERAVPMPMPPASLRNEPRVVSMGEPIDAGDYEFPSLDLLVPMAPHHRRRVDSDGASLLREALQTFDIGIQGEIEIYPGPVITRYEFRPAPGVKVNQVVGLADDIALALSASRVRVVAPVPGKAAVGIEIPNRDPEMVSLRRILESREFAATDAVLPLALGESIDGRPYVADLASMPHLLIAGATGSGKSVCINVIVASLLYRHHPRDVRLLFVDPKRLELSVYAGIPHMAKPVVTQPKAAERLLADAAREMDDRYKRLAGSGVRNIVDYNRKSDESERLPYLIIVVDELADLMMSAEAARIELLITRLAQMARAVGIHLILATQRPSVDVITGLIKANFSCRIAFQVASKTDSRTILDANGAEKLLGRGDMLYLAPGQPEALRVHGAYISSEETSSLVTCLREQIVEVSPVSAFAAVSSNAESGGGDPDDDPTSDPLFLQAAEVVCRHKQGSVSLLQRRCGIGYQRAARLIDRLEEAGVVGPYDGSKAREVLISVEELERRFAKPVP